MSERQNKDPLFLSKKLLNNRSMRISDRYETAPVAISNRGCSMFHMKRLGWSPLRVLLNLEALLELAASSVDIVAARVTDRGLNATGLKTTLKVFNLMNR